MYDMYYLYCMYHVQNYSNIEMMLTSPLPINIVLLYTIIYYIVGCLFKLMLHVLLLRIVMIIFFFKSPTTGFKSIQQHVQCIWLYNICIQAKYDHKKDSENTKVKLRSSPTRCWR